MSGVRSVSVLVFVSADAARGERPLAALAGLAAQEFERPWDVLALVPERSPAEDRLGELAGEFPVPLRVLPVDPEELHPADSLNELAAHAAGDVLVLLDPEAAPVGPGWLRRVAACFDDARVGAMRCGRVAPADASPLARLLARDDPAAAAERRVHAVGDVEEYARTGPAARAELYALSASAGALRRALWERFPFPRVDAGAPALVARALLEAGHALVHEPAAAVAYAPEPRRAQVAAAAAARGRFEAEHLDLVRLPTRADVERETHAALARDRELLAAEGLAGDALARALGGARELRAAAFGGLHRGARATVRRPAGRLLRGGLLRGGPLRVLFVVHSFPPDTWAGTEVHTLQLARGLADRGHECAVLARTPSSPADADLADWSVAEDEREGLRVLRVTNRAAHESLRDAYRHTGAEEMFAEVLRRERPDVVHFQHLMHLSAGLIGVARGAGAATVMTCNDYWALCPRVQLVRPGGGRCRSSRGLGCLACVELEQHAAAIPIAQAVGPVLRGASRLARRVANGPRLPSVKLERALHPWRVRASLVGRSWIDMGERQEYVLGQLAAADLLIAPSRFLRDLLLASGRLDAERFVYSDYGLRTAGLARASRDGGAARLRLGFVGSFVRYKGVDVLVRAMRSLPADRVSLDLFGDYRPDEDPYHAELRDLAAGAPVSFRGRFDNDRLAAVHARIDVLVVPSVWYENSPITIHEAWCTGTPTLVSRLGGMAELVRDGEDGLHFRAGDARDLASKVRRLLDEPGLLERLRGARRRVKTIEENAAEMEYRYRALVARGR